MAVITNRAASALARLRNRAKQGGISYQHCLQLFVQEEFLRRLSLSPYRKHLVLKGGLFIYSLESSIAEKLDAMLRRLELNSRMKDFYDVYFLSRHFPFDGATLAKALHDTMANRQTPCDDALFSRLVSLENHEGMLRKWDSFLNTLHHEALPFNEVMRGIIRFLAPVVHTVAESGGFARKWQPVKGWIDR